jgi:uncharacterized protein (TIGR02118 family)
MIRLQVLYGHPKDPRDFDRYYREVHLPIARRIRGFTRWTIGKVQGTPDGKPSPWYLIADLFAESRAAMDAILATPEGQAAIRDVPNFATGGVTFVYTEVEQLV